MKKVDWKDVFVRAGKTFAQAFFGIVIPELATILNGGFSDISTTWKVLAPFVASALAAGISAVWNGVFSPMFKPEEDNV